MELESRILRLRGFQYSVFWFTFWMIGFKVHSNSQWTGKKKSMIDLSTPFRTVHFLQQMGIKHFGQKKDLRKDKWPRGILYRLSSSKEKRDVRNESFYLPLILIGVKKLDKNCFRNLKIYLSAILFLSVIPSKECRQEQLSTELLFSLRFVWFYFY